MDKEQMMNIITETLEKSWVPEQIWYMISRKGRESRNISKFLKEQIENYTGLLDAIIVQNGWHEISNDDYLIVEITKWVKKNITYITDTLNYKDVEYWANILEILTGMKDDCEGGAYLIVALGRRCGISKERLKLICGDVWNQSKKQVAGHCWVIYKSLKYWTVWYFMDWCYYFRAGQIYGTQRRPAYIFDNELRITPFNNEYIQGWFVVDEEKGSRRLRI